jgi:hypothetical protein
MSKGTGCHQAVEKPLLITAALFAFLVTATANAQDVLLLPNWSDLFNANGTLKDAVDDAGAAGSNGEPDYVDLYGGTDAIFIGDNISDGVAVDMSVPTAADTLEDTVVYNDTVASSHDVGNAFVLTTTDSQNNLVLYGAAERLGPAQENSYIEFEFTQDIVQAAQVNAPLRGSRTTGDLLVRLNLTEGVLTSAQLSRWSGVAGYQSVATVSPVVGGVACVGNETTHLVCDPYLASGLFDYQSQFNPWTEPWDPAGIPVQVSEPNGLLEFAVNVGVLLGGENPDYSSIVVRTPGDIIIDSFRNHGYWAQAGN